MNDKPFTQEDLLITHILEVIGNCLPCDLRDVYVSGRAVKLTLSYRDYCRQCYMGVVKGEVALTFDELLSKEEEPYEGYHYYDQAKVRELISSRFEANLAEKRKKGYHYE